MSLYPPLEPYSSEFLPVSEVHTLFVAQYGNPNGSPVVCIHGGPGAGLDVEDAQRFNPNKYRVILYDQRGSGKSTPASCLEDNTTTHLIDDLEFIKKHLKVDGTWHVFGWSWGTTLALAYAQAHPASVKSLVLRGIFTFHQSEVDFLYQGPGANFFFPDEWEKYLAPIPEDERGDMIKAYHKRLTGVDPRIRDIAGQAWSRWELAISRLYVDPEYIAQADKPGFADAFARIECHYMMALGFFPQGSLTAKESIDKIRNIPTIIIHGRYDSVCSLSAAWNLFKQFPEAEMVIVPDAGHSALDPGMQKALLEATDKFSTLP
ncbi:proline iminopeptidase [Meredithblackwellia eburnea MCA 4105]